MKAETNPICPFCGAETVFSEAPREMFDDLQDDEDILTCPGDCYIQGVSIPRSQWPIPPNAMNINDLKMNTPNNSEAFPPIIGSPSLLTDKELANVNPGIRLTIQSLRSWGFCTMDSGDGKTHQFDCDRPHPYVVIRVEPEKMIDESHRLMELLEEFDIRFDDPPHGQDDPEGWAAYPRIESIYMPMERIAIIDLANVIIPENSNFSEPASSDTHP